MAVHPEDERFRHLIGREVEVPLVGRRIPVIGDPYVDREFGTGALKITPGAQGIELPPAACGGAPGCTHPCGVCSLA